MTKVSFTFEDNKIDARKGETVLDSLLRVGVRVTSSCKSGICHSCVLKSHSKLDSISQKGLSLAKRESGYFLACQQKVSSELSVFRGESSTMLVDAYITSQQRISDSVVIVKVKTLDEYSFKAGQFTNLIRRDGTCRSYSIASQTGSSELEFHIRKVQGGILSTWLYDNDLIDEPIKLSEALGECYLSPEIESNEFLFVGVGTGLAPLYGVLKDLIAEKRIGKVNLLHGGLNVESLYLVEELKALEVENEFFTYHPVFLKGEQRKGFHKGDLIDFVRDLEFDKSETTVMICGDPQLVRKLKQEVFLAGVASSKILSDPFVSHFVNK